MAAINRMTYDPEPRNYVEKLRAKGKSDKEIRRCIKSYLARRVFRILSAAAQAKRFSKRLDRNRRVYDRLHSSLGHRTPEEFEQTYYDEISGSLPDTASHKTAA